MEASRKRQNGEERRGWRSQKQLSLERCVWRAGVRHEGTEADVPVTAWHFMDCTVDFFQHLFIRHLDTQVIPLARGTL